MPKKSSGRRRKQLIVGRIRDQVALGALAADTLISALFAEVTDQEMFALSCDICISMRGHTAGEGPITVGIAHGDYNDAEIEENLENTGGWQVGDLVAREKAKRKVRVVGTFDGLNTEEKLFDGAKKRIKLKFTISEGETLRIWGYNESGAPLSTGTVIEATGEIYMVPI